MGGFIVGPQPVIDLLRQHTGRPCVLQQRAGSHRSPPARSRSIEIAAGRRRPPREIDETMPGCFRDGLAKAGFELLLGRSRSIIPG